MPLEAGTKLHSYTVLGLLATGGMGRCTGRANERLGRDVAVKILAPALAGEGKELERFEREARTLAALAIRTSSTSSTSAARRHPLRGHGAAPGRDVA